MRRRDFIKGLAATVVAALVPVALVQRRVDRVSERALDDAIQKCWVEGEVPRWILADENTWKVIKAEDGAVYDISPEDTPFMSLLAEKKNVDTHKWQRDPLQSEFIDGVECYISDFGMLEVKRNAV